MLEKAQLAIAADVSAGDWIREGLATWEPLSDHPVTIGIAIPKGFESYALVRHSPWGEHPREFDDKPLDALLNVLADFTSTPDDCFHALWDGHGWMHSGSIVSYSTKRLSRISRLLRPISRRFRGTTLVSRPRMQTSSLNHLDEHTLPEGTMQAERFKLPTRRYFLLRGPLSQSRKIQWNFAGLVQSQFPNLLWPSDRAWILVNEIDFDVTLIGGSEKLVSTLLNTPSISAQRFKITDRVSELAVVSHE